MVVPRITTNVKSNIVLTAGDEFSTGAMSGEATWGVQRTVKTFSNYQDVVDTYKSGKLVDGARYFFNAGGKTLLTTRVDPTSVADVKATKTFTGPGPSNSFVITAKYAGTHGNNISVAITTNGSNRDIVITDGETIESYLNLASNTAIVAAITADSELVDATLSNATPLVDAISATFLLLGADGTAVTQDYLDTLDAELLLKDFDLYMAPGKTADAFHSSVQAKMDTRATSENKFTIYVTGVDKFEANATSLARTATNGDGRLIVCHTAIYKGDGDVDNANSYDDGSYSGCGLAGFLASLPVQTSPTNEALPFSAAKSAAEQFYTSAEKEELADAGFVVFDRLSGGAYGVVIGVTRNGDESDYSYMLDNRRKVDFLLERSVDAVKGFIGDPNDDFTRNSIRTAVVSIMVGAKTDRILSDFLVDVLKGTDPREVDVNITVQLIQETDFINVNLTLSI